jgi:periplasmic copper chaperone A
MTPEHSPAPPSGSGRRRVLVSLILAFAAGAASAQDFSAGDIAIRHPFATPTRPGASVGAAYFGGLQNLGSRPDRLLRASTPASARVELHSGEIGSDGVMRMRELDSLPLPAGATIELRPGKGDHLMLMDLRKPLKQGESFPMTLHFELAGAVEVKVVVQEAGAAAGHSSGHKH